MLSDHGCHLGLSSENMYSDYDEQTRRPQLNLTNGQAEIVNFSLNNSQMRDQQKYTQLPCHYQSGQQ